MSSNECDQTLEYAALQARRGRDPAHWPPLFLLIGFLIGSWLLASTGGKVTPGGPFISISSDVAPVLLSLVIIILSWRSLRYGRLSRRLVIALIILCSVFELILVLLAVYSFWFRPFARDILVDW